MAILLCGCGGEDPADPRLVTQPPRTEASAAAEQMMECPLCGHAFDVSRAKRSTSQRAPFVCPHCGESVKPRAVSKRRGRQ